MPQSLLPIAEYIDLNNQGSQQANAFAQFLNEMTLEMAAVYSFFFLPFFLLSWLGVLKVFEFEKKIRQIVVPILIISYFACIGFLKLEGRKQVVVSGIEHQVAYYLVYHNLQQIQISTLCAHTPLTEDDINRLAGSRANYFSIIQGALHLKDPKIVQVIKDRLKHFSQVIIANASQAQHLPVDSLIQVANDANFGGLSSATLEQVARDNPGKIRYQQSEDGDFLIVEP